MKLYTYYRSQASFRVRIALNLKGIAREDSFLHLEKGDQFAAAYRAINPQMVVPTLIDGDIKLFQSLAILEYLDEAYPEPPLLPAEPVVRAWVRGVALINAADSHPLIVPRVRRENACYWRSQARPECLVACRKRQACGNANERPSRPSRRSCRSAGWSLTEKRR